MSNVSASGGGGLHEDGSPIAIELGANESVTVPTGEAWVVDIIADTADTYGVSISVNATSAISDHFHSAAFSTVFRGGDTIEEIAGNSGIQIGGFAITDS